MSNSLESLFFSSTLIYKFFQVLECGRQGKRAASHEHSGGELGRKGGGDEEEPGFSGKGGRETHLLIQRLWFLKRSNVYSLRFTVSGKKALLLSKTGPCLPPSPHPHPLEGKQSFPVPGSKRLTHLEELTSWPNRCQSLSGCDGGRLSRDRNVEVS